MSEIKPSTSNNLTKAPRKQQHSKGKSKSKSKKKPINLQIGHVGFLVVIDEKSVEATAGTGINELTSFFESFSDSIDDNNEETTNFIHNYENAELTPSTTPNTSSSSNSNGFGQEIDDDFPPLPCQATASSTTTTTINSTTPALTEASSTFVEFNKKLTLNNDKSDHTDIVSAPKSSYSLPNHQSNEAGSSTSPNLKNSNNNDANKNGRRTTPNHQHNQHATIQTPKSYRTEPKNNVLPSSISNQFTDNTYGNTYTQHYNNSSIGLSNNNSASPSLLFPMVQFSDIANSNTNSHEKLKDFPQSSPGVYPGGLSKIQLKRKQFYQMQSRTFNMEKPQLKFSTPVVNDHSPFKPLLTKKPHSILPLNLQPMKDSKTGKIFYPHPYLKEIDEWKPPQQMMTRTIHQWPLTNLQNTQCFIVQSLQSLKLMMRDLHQVDEIGFDVEHSDRSFFGLTCIIQLSTRYKDYIIDCFSLRDHLQCLNEVFANPRVLKVAHSANCDVINLQRDFGVYVVGLFDTAEAAKSLSENKRSIGLATLLSELLNVETDKKYQLADWRIRPLPRDMIDYARTDTHYLLHLYDILKYQLLSYGTPKLLIETFENSKEICRYRYDKPNFDHWLGKYNEKYNNQQKYALVELNKWRDQVARLMDEGVGHVASQKILSILSETLPSTRDEIQRQLRQGGGRKIPDLLERDLPLILEIISKAKNLPLVMKTKEKGHCIIGESVNTKVNHIFFLKTKSQNVNPNEIVNKIIDRRMSEGHLFVYPKYIQKIFPVAKTCHRENNVIFQELEQLLMTYENDSDSVFYGVSIDLHSDELFSGICKSVQSVKPSWIFTTEQVNMTHKIVIHSFINLNLACLSVMKQHFEM